MGDRFEGLDSLGLAEHVQRWSSPEEEAVQGSIHNWLAAAQQFAARIIENCDSIAQSEWRAVSDAWGRLLTAAEQSVGPQRNEWLLRDLNLSAVLLNRVGPREGVALLDPPRLLSRALDAMPMRPTEARELGPKWRSLAREQIRDLRMIRLLLSPLSLAAEHLHGLPRAREFDDWLEASSVLP